jgi:hypothetical protein
MKLQLKRFEFGTTYTISKLYNGEEYICFVVEDKVREVEGKPVKEWKVQNETAIPKGTYKLVLNMSTRFKKEMPQILNVPGFEGVRIHSGNSSKDTEGCLIVGMNWTGGDWVSNSKAAYDKLFALLKSAKEEITITIG